MSKKQQQDQLLSELLEEILTDKFEWIDMLEAFELSFPEHQIIEDGRFENIRNWEDIPLVYRRDFRAWRFGKAALLKTSLLSK